MLPVLVLAAAAALPQEPPERPPFLPGEGLSSFEDERALFGPLQMQTLSPFSSFRPGFAPRAASSLPPGGIEFRQSDTWADVWALNEHDWRIDYEAVRSNISLAYGLSDYALLELDVQSIDRLPGRLDRLIVSFHETVGAEQRHRDEYPRGDLHFEIEDGPGVFLSEEELRTPSQAMTLTLECRTGTLAAERSVLSGFVSLRRGFGGVIGQEGPADLAVGASWARRFGDFTAYAAMSFAWYGDEELASLELRSTQWAGLGAVEWKCSNRVSIVFQYLLTEGVLERPRPFARPSSEVALGLKYLLKPGVLLEIAAVENLIIPDNSPDFGVHGGLTVRW